MASLITVTHRDRVRWLTISRPSQLNALNSAVLSELHHEIASANADDAVGCVVIAGEGDRAFCAGADLAEIRGLNIAQAHAFIQRGHATMRAIEESRIPVVAAVDGYALGGGFEMMLACHIALATTTSKFGLPEARIGCIPGFGGTQRLARATTRPIALDLMLTGTPITADHAWQAGLLSRPPLAANEFNDVVTDTAVSIANHSRSGTALILEAARSTLNSDGLAHEAALAAIAIASADGQEGIASFAERRTPDFTRGARA